MSEKERGEAFAAYNFLTTAEIAQALRASDDFILDRVHKADAQGFRFRAIRKGRDYLFDPSEVQRFIKAHLVGDAA